MNEFEQKLAEPFDPQEIKCRPGKIVGNRCLVLHYIDARLVMDRLDEVVGVLGWQDNYEVLPGGCVACRLMVRLQPQHEWVVKMDVGSPSEQSDDGDQLKAAFSDALKRAAVKFGIGRYLYSLGSPPVWADYDEKTKKVAKMPELPPWARPAQKAPLIDQDIRKAAMSILEPAARQGIKAYELAWSALSREMRIAVAQDHPKLKERANAATGS